MLLLFEALNIITSVKEDGEYSGNENAAAFEIAEKAITAQIRLSEMLNSWWDNLKEEDHLSAQVAYEILETIRFDYDPTEEEDLEEAEEEDQKKEKAQTAVGVIQETIDEICRNFCKYGGTENDEAECEWIREGNECPLDRLQ